MEIKQAQPEHIPALLELLRQVGQVHHEIRPDIFRATCQKYDEITLLELLKDEKKPIFVAEEEQGVTGYCFCQIREYRNSPALTDRLELYIDDLCVDEGRRGGGVAQALFAHANDYARALGCAFVTLNVWCGNDRAMAFYEKMGLRPRHIMMELPLCDQ